jgi:hypothetical protein
MDIKKIGYSSRRGFTIEFQRPDGFEMGITAAKTVLAILNAKPSRQQVLEQFKTNEELEVVNRYIDLLHDCTLHAYEQTEKMKITPKQFYVDLEYWVSQLAEGMEAFAKEYYGWEPFTEAEEQALAQAAWQKKKLQEAIDKNSRWMAEWNLHPIATIPESLKAQLVETFGEDILNTPEQA